MPISGGFGASISMGERGLGFKLACKAETDSAMKERPVRLHQKFNTFGGAACIPQTNMKTAQDCRV